MTTARTVQIRIGAVKRLTKEMASRRVDVETEKKRTARLIAEGEDQWTVGKQKEVVAEAERMIPDSRDRLEGGLTDLKALLEAAGTEISEDTRKEAEGVIKDGQAAIVA